MKFCLSVVVGTAALVEFASPSYATGASFTPLGDLAGGSFYSYAHGISADGSVIVGEGASANGAEGFVWDAQYGMRGIGDIPGATSGAFASRALDVSGDGRVVIGYNARKVVPITWTSGSGIQVLGTGNAVATATNMDGSIIVGWDFIWNLRTQSVTRLGDLPGALPQSFAYAVSDDGLVVAGRSQNGAFVWDARNGMRDLSFSIGDFGSYFYALSALGLSSDGSVVVGSGPRNATMTEAFRWTESGGMQELGFLTGQSGYSQAQAVSADGSIVVGSSSTFESNSGRVAFIWDAEHGMRPLNVVLAELGVDTDGWSLDIAMDISADGTRIVGSGKNPAGATEAFLIVIPEPSTMCFLALGLVWLAGARRPHSGFGRAQFVSSIREGSQRSRARLRSTAN